MRIEPPPHRRHRLSLTPMIDVVFLLVVFFMLVSSFIDLRAIELSAPAERGAGVSKEGAILVRVLGNGRLDLNGVDVTLAGLESQLQAYLLRDPEQRVLVQPGRAVPLQRLVDVLDRLNAAGATQLTLMKN